MIIIILGLLLWFFMGSFVYSKQKKAFSKTTSIFEEDTGLFLCAFFAPLVLIGYMIRATFFEDWI